MLEGGGRDGKWWELFQGEKTRKHFSHKEKHWCHSTTRNIYYISFSFTLSAFSEEQQKPPANSEHQQGFSLD